MYKDLGRLNGLRWNKIYNILTLSKASSELPNPLSPNQVAASDLDKDECSYVDPESYETPSQALFAVAREMDPHNIKLVEEIGEGVLLCLHCDI